MNGMTNSEPRPFPSPTGKGRSPGDAGIAEQGKILTGYERVKAGHCLTLLDKISRHGIDTRILYAELEKSVNKKPYDRDVILVQMILVCDKCGWSPYRSGTDLEKLAKYMLIKTKA